MPDLSQEFKSSSQLRLLREEKSKIDEKQDILGIHKRNSYHS